MVLVRPFAHGWMALAHIDRGEHEQARRARRRAGRGAGRPLHLQLVAVRARAARARAGRAGARARGPARVRSPPAGRSRRRTPACCRGARRRRSPPTRSAAPSRRARWRTRSWSSRARSARRARSASRCAPPGSSPRPASGSALLEQAVAALERSPAQLELARALVDLGAAQHAAGQRTAARETLRTGARHRPPRGADGARRARPARSSWRPARARGGRRVRGADALTPSERRVAELAERGPHEPRDRAGAVRLDEDGRVPSAQRVLQAADRLARRRALRRRGRSPDAPPRRGRLRRGRRRGSRRRSWRRRRPSRGTRSSPPAASGATHFDAVGVRHRGAVRRRVDHARQQRVAAHALVAVLDRDRLRERDHAAFAAT